jgi:regulator of protease activity HflC (stomatin/prohibitin superfamily)
VNDDGLRAWHIVTPLVVVLLLVVGGMAGCPAYNVYQQRMEGEAELAKANYSKRVAVQEAEAKKDSASALAQAEVLRAEGVAKANRIIGESLRGNEGYLRYLWIQGLESGAKPDVIYVPTEAGLPILEAGRFGQPLNERAAKAIEKAFEKASP